MRSADFDKPLDEEGRADVDRYRRNYFHDYPNVMRAYGLVPNGARVGLHSRTTAAPEALATKE